MSTLESNQIVSGQAVDNTLQLNKQGGGRIDIPLPESMGYLLGKVRVTADYSVPTGTITCSACTSFDDNGTQKVYINSNIPIYYTTNNINPPYGVRITGYQILDKTVKTNICNTVFKNLPDGTYSVAFCADTNENMVVYTSGYVDSTGTRESEIIISDGIITPPERGIFFSISGSLANNTPIYITACYINKIS